MVRRQGGGCRRELRAIARSLLSFKGRRTSGGLSSRPTLCTLHRVLHRPGPTAWIRSGVESDCEVATKYRSRLVESACRVSDRPDFGRARCRGSRISRPCHCGDLARLACVRADSEDFLPSTQPKFVAAVNVMRVGDYALECNLSQVIGVNCCSKSLGFRVSGPHLRWQIVLAYGSRLSNQVGELVGKILLRREVWPHMSPRF